MKTIRKTATATLLLVASVVVSNAAPAAHMVVPVAIPVTAPIVLAAQLSVPQEASQTSANTPADATGGGVFLFNPQTDVLSYAVVYAGLSGNPTMAHFHLGAATTNGPILQTICGMPAPTLAGACPSATAAMISGTWSVPKDEVKSLLEGKVYVNFHTTLNPNGEIRGQLVPN